MAGGEESGKMPLLSRINPQIQCNPNAKLTEEKKNEPNPAFVLSPHGERSSRCSEELPVARFPEPLGVRGALRVAPAVP